jgi:cytochrome P450 PksS
LAEAVLQGSMMRADFTSQAYFRNPAAEIEKLRSAGPVVEVQFPMVGKVWTTTTQDLADRVLKDSETFTIRDGIGGVAGLQWWMPRIVRTLANHMLSKDEPDHKRLRDIVDEAFRRRAVLEMEPRILAIADELAGELFAEGSPTDLVERYARKLPLSVICELLGLPLNASWRQRHRPAFNYPQFRLRQWLPARCRSGAIVRAT